MCDKHLLHYILSDKDKEEKTDQTTESNEESEVSGLKRKKRKKKVTWADEAALRRFHYFELDDNERGKLQDCHFHVFPYSTILILRDLIEPIQIPIDMLRDLIGVFH